MFEIKIDLDRWRTALTQMQPNFVDLPAILQAQTAYIQQVWQSAVQGEVYPGMSRSLVNDSYFQGISSPGSLQYPFNGDEFAAAVICFFKGALSIERGYPSFDMKPGLLAGTKHRVSREGVPYTIIPFRHGAWTSGSPTRHFPMMPKLIYDIVRKGIPKTGAGAGILETYGGRSRMVTRHISIPGNVNPRIRVRQAVEDEYEWKRGQYAGMKKLPKGSGYMTFRTVSGDSDPASWIHPGVSANPIMLAVYNKVKPEIEKAIRVALFGASI